MKGHSKQWFIDRIGKTIYRKPIDSCSCEHCQKTNFIILDEQHAMYVKLNQDELGIDYFDKPLEGK